jgi:hypothetical protein
MIALAAGWCQATHFGKQRMVMLSLPTLTGLVGR